MTMMLAECPTGLKKAAEADTEEKQRSLKERAAKLESAREAAGNLLQRRA